MNRPTDKQIEEVLAGIASPEDAKYGLPRKKVATISKPL